MGEAFAGLVLAAGKGSRFPSESGRPFPKVLRSVLGRPMISYVLDTLTEAGIEDVTLVVGFGADEVRRRLSDRVGYVLQEEQRGSGDAVARAKDRFREFEGHVVVMCGDSPLFTAETVGRMMRKHVEEHAVATLTSATLRDPSGYGRILRDSGGSIRAIVEERCATDAQRSIREVNGGAYAFDAAWLFHPSRYDRLHPSRYDTWRDRDAAWLFANIDRMAINEAGEYNLTDMIRVAVEQSATVTDVACDPTELLGVNTPEHLDRVEHILRDRVVRGA